MQLLWIASSRYETAGDDGKGNPDAVEQSSPMKQSLHSKAMTVGLGTHKRMLGDYRCFPFVPGFSCVIEEPCMCKL